LRYLIAAVDLNVVSAGRPGYIHFMRMERCYGSVVKAMDSPAMRFRTDSFRGSS